jgi:hypothetical protein
MAIVAKEGEVKSFYLIPAETMAAVCFDIWDLGMQNTGFKDKDGNDIIQHKVIIAFETSELIPDGPYKGKRACINKEYTLSLGEKANLRKDLESWRGVKFTPDELKGFDIEVLVGKGCMLSILHGESKKGKVYPKIGGISKLMKGLSVMVPESKRSLPDWIIKRRDQAVILPPTDDVAELSGSEIAEEVIVQEEEPLPF